uniref:Uncharacterized protein n=1 Tax=Rhizophora mucronata TaxID=61149 RepID=A0A2P2P363_RHIMU
MVFAPLSAFSSSGHSLLIFQFLSNLIGKSTTYSSSTKV